MNYVIPEIKPITLRIFTTELVKRNIHKRKIANISILTKKSVNFYFKSGICILY